MQPYETIQGNINVPKYGSLGFQAVEKGDYVAFNGASIAVIDGVTDLNGTKGRLGGRKVPGSVVAAETAKSVFEEATGQNLVGILMEINRKIGEEMERNGIKPEKPEDRWGAVVGAARFYAGKEGLMMEYAVSGDASIWGVRFTDDGAEAFPIYFPSLHDLPTLRMLKDLMEKGKGHGEALNTNYVQAMLRLIRNLVNTPPEEIRNKLDKLLGGIGDSGTREYLRRYLNDLRNLSYGSLNGMEYPIIESRTVPVGGYDLVLAMTDGALPPDIGSHSSDAYSRMVARLAEQYRNGGINGLAEEIKRLHEEMSLEKYPRFTQYPAFAVAAVELRDLGNR